VTYFGKRYLVPGLGRWASADPLAVHSPGSADLNVYAYVRGQVLRAVDPTGLQDCDPGAGGCSQSGSGSPNGGGPQSGSPVGSGDGTGVMVSAAAYLVRDVVETILGGSSANAPENATAGREKSQTLTEQGGKVVTLVSMAKLAQLAERIFARAAGAPALAPLEAAALDGAPKPTAPRPLSVGAAAADDPAIQVGRLNPRGDPYVQVGEGGSYADLKSRADIGDKITPHHMPQKKMGFTSEAEGGCVTCFEAEHMKTRTWGPSGKVTAKADAGVPFRDLLARDIRDFRQINGTKYDSGIRRMLEYYHSNFPALMAKPKIDVGGGSF
jgi:hypothetical protein